MLRKSDEDLLMNFLQSQNLNNSNSQFLLDKLETFAKNRGIRASKGTLAGFINRARIQSKQLLPLSEKKEKPQQLCTSVQSINLEDVQAPEFFVPHILSTGVTFCNSPPKGGKSRLFMQLALALASGGVFMGRQCRKTDVLYLALEDERQDFESRLRLFLQGKEAPANLFFATSEDFDYCPPTLENDELVDIIQDNLRARPGIRVVLIDVFGCIRSKRQRGEDFMDTERRDIQTLVRLAAKNNIALLVAHHVSHTKRRGTLETIGSGAGSYTIAATIHAEWLLITNDRGTTFSVQGRRIPLQKFAVEDCFPHWRYCGGVDEYEAANDPLIITIKHIVDHSDTGKWSGSGSDIVRYGQENGLPVIPEKINKHTFSRELIAVYQRFAGFPINELATEQAV